VRVGVADAACVTVELAVAVPVSAVGVVAAGVGVAVRTGRVTLVVLVESTAGLVGRGVMVAYPRVRVEVGVVVCVERYGGTGVYVWIWDKPVGVGVNRKIPVTTSSFPSSSFPSSRRITFKTAGSRGATFS